MEAPGGGAILKDMSDPARPLMTVEEFLAWDDGTDTRYELVGGRPVAMAPPSDAHAVMAANVVLAIGSRLRAPCRVRVEAGIRFPERNDRWFQADVMVSCSPGSGRPETPDPTIVVEVLSPSTESHDRAVKLPAYREIPSVQEILLISSTKRRAELWRRLDGEWRVQDFIGDGVLRFPSQDAEIPLSALYDGVL